jgi:hypothetical protein
VLLFLLILADSPIIITEVMSNVKGTDSGSGTPGDRNEFVEIYNQSADTVDLAQYFISDFDADDELSPWEDDAILIHYPGVRIHSTRIYPYSYALILDREYTSSDTVGGYVQPYDFPDSVLILTTDDTSIGGTNITTNDPLLIFSEVEACTTSFGTPFDTLDDFPSDPGDGISWERIDLELPDEPSNWHPSVDSAGCTPGRENSTTMAFDLALDDQSILFTPASVKTGEDVQIEIRVKNCGLRETDEYSVTVFDDENSDSSATTNEIVTQLDGIMVNALDSISLFYTYEHPSQGSHMLGFEIIFPSDQNPENNLAFRELQVLGEIGELALSPQIFSPNADGIDDVLQIDYRLPQPGGNLTISIFDMRGKRIHDVLKNELSNQDSGTLFWDGTSPDGDVPTSMYIVYLEYRYSNTITKAKKTTILAR